MQHRHPMLVPDSQATPDDQMNRDLPLNVVNHGLMEASAPAPKRRKLAEDEVEHPIIGGEAEIAGILDQPLRSHKTCPAPTVLVGVVLTQ